MIKRYFMSLSTFLLVLGVLVGCGGVGDDQNYNNDNNLRDVRNPGLDNVTPRDVDFNDNMDNNNVGDEYEPDLDEEPSEQLNDDINNNDLNNTTNDLGKNRLRDNNNNRK